MAAPIPIKSQCLHLFAKKQLLRNATTFTLNWQHHLVGDRALSNLQRWSFKYEPFYLCKSSAVNSVATKYKHFWFHQRLLPIFGKKTVIFNLFLIRGNHCQFWSLDGATCLNCGVFLFLENRGKRKGKMSSDLESSFLCCF